MAINLVFLSDENFVQHLSVAMSSAIVNCSRTLDIHVFHNGLSSKSREKLQQTLKLGAAQLFLHEVTLEDFRDAPVSTQWPMLIYAKLMMDKLLTLDKILLLDCDTVIMDDLALLYDTPLQGHAVGACHSLASARRIAYLNIEPLNYFNAGVLLYDLDKCRSLNLSHKLLELCRQKKDIIKYPEQDLMNLYFNGDWLRLDLKWNFFANLTKRRIKRLKFYDKEQLFAALKNPKIIHFTTIKPWNCALPSSPYDRHYRKFLQLTPYRDYKYPKATLADCGKYLRRKIIRPIEAWF